LEDEEGLEGRWGMRWRLEQEVEWRTLEVDWKV
jgi:hypothetical protein